MCSYLLQAAPPQPAEPGTAVSSELVSLCATPGTTLDQVPLLASAHLVAVRQVRLLRKRGVVMRLAMTVLLLTASPPFATPGGASGPPLCMGWRALPASTQAHAKHVLLLATLRRLGAVEGKALGMQASQALSCRCRSTKAQNTARHFSGRALLRCACCRCSLLT